MTKFRRSLALPVLLGLALVAGACGSSSNSSTQSTPAATTAPPSETTGAVNTTAPPVETTAPVPEGGTVTIAAEQEPDCADWMGSCGGSSWGYWMMNVGTMPRSFDIVKDGDAWVYKASGMLAGEPTLVTSPKQVVTYKINPAAVWSDGNPITSSDFKYTWDQIVTQENIYDASGYSSIESVDDSAPDTAVVTYKEPYAGWKGLFGGGYGVFNSKALTGKDRDVEMKDGYSWSGGPWKIDKWEKGVSITLVPNTTFWGQKPHLDKLVFVFTADTAAEFKAVQAGEVQGAYPQPQLDVVDALGSGIDGFTADVNATTTPNLEALWMNNAKAPFDTKEVRMAVAYALDRDAIVNRLFGGLGVKTAVNSLEPGLVRQYTDVDAFAAYKLDLAKVDSLMKGAGWAKGADGIWAKGGKKASFVINSTTGNKRRETTEQVIQEQLKTAGFEMTIDNKKAGDLFGQILPAGDYQLALYAQVLTSLEPGLNTLFNSKNIPTAANGNVGQNWQRVNIPSNDATLQALDTTLDDAARQKAGKDAIKVLADNMISLPLDPLPNIWLHSTKIGGSVSDNPILGPFASSNTWTISS